MISSGLHFPECACRFVRAINITEEGTSSLERFLRVRAQSISCKEIEKHYNQAFHGNIQSGSDLRRLEPVEKHEAKCLPVYRTLTLTSNLWKVGRFKCNTRAPFPRKIFYLHAPGHMRRRVTCSANWFVGTLLLLAIIARLLAIYNPKTRSVASP